MAEKVSPEIAAARAAVGAAEGRRRQAEAFPNPVASYSREQTSDKGAKNAQEIIAVEQQLEIGGQRRARRAAARVGLELARSTPRPFDLVITDSRLPELSGSDLVKRLREMDPALPMLNLSGSHGQHTVTSDHSPATS
jgi:CheY-like chemotaxis protein